ncbi:cryptochrome/photolyase family protein [Thiohalocapsa marina]|uniref:Cryptochrome/photolyase family protein n=1 Tax=Thiohalocapsa marina TaxID=424902 RepID=A0A5M8FAZ2_9GAMM|nr:cryptochrome/photolyase family protein [Thiohalocapsa marina]KAA6181897.1 cryptochrome/photolyase family protein [Thiohalocapsa marina]
MTEGAQTPATRAEVHVLRIVLGDQLNRTNPALRDCDPQRDLIWLCEAPAEATHVPSHRARTVLFLSAMRHFRDQLRAEGLSVRYLALDQHHYHSLGEALQADLSALRPERVCLTQPGEYRVATELAAACEAAGLPLQVLEDDHFLCARAEFEGWARGRKELRMEHFYRWIRRRDGVLLQDGEPVGGAWNFDKDNRKAFGRQGPGLLPEPLGFAPDAVTREVMALVEARFPHAPGRLDRFDWPVTAAQAQAALEDFIRHRLAAFGPFQDAMWQGEPYLYHARLSAALNLKLLDPRQAVAAAVDAWRDGRAPIASVEGFVRQIIGWREYVRGLYWLRMPQALDENVLTAQQPLPAFYWSADTPYVCLADSIGQVLEHGYAHHIQRLMVTGLFALLLGVEPRRVHQWYLAMFVDAVEWVEAPNTLGMSQFADGGRLASKPYAASGAYIARMSNYCRHCRFDPKQSVGDQACPFTTLFWDFLARHRERFAGHPRTALMWRNLDRLEPDTLAAIRQQAERLRRQLADGA